MSNVDGKDAFGLPANKTWGTFPCAGSHSRKTGLFPHSLDRKALLPVAEQRQSLNFSLPPHAYDLLIYDLIDMQSSDMRCSPSLQILGLPV